jgi:hypothetical protein
MSHRMSHRIARLRVLVSGANATADRRELVRAICSCGPRECRDRSGPVLLGGDTERQIVQTGLSAERLPQVAYRPGLAP